MKPFVPLNAPLRPTASAYVIGGLIFAVILVLALLAGALLMALSVPARADAVSLQPLFDEILNPTLETILEGIALAITAWLAWLLRKYCPGFLRAWLDDRAMKRIEKIVNDAVADTLQRARAWETAHQDVEIQGKVKAIAARWAVAYAAKDVKRLGLDPEALANMALAKIPVPPGAPGPAAPITPVTRQDLPPIAGK